VTYEIPPTPEYEFYEKLEPPNISWRRAKQALAVATETQQFLTIPGWRTHFSEQERGWQEPEVEARPLMGEYHNERRVQRLRATRPHGMREDGAPWYVGVLYAAPRDPIYGYDDLVGIVTWVGHIACLLPGGGQLMRPIVEWLAKEDRHYLVPVMADNPEELYVLSPSRRNAWQQRRKLGIPEPEVVPCVLDEYPNGDRQFGVPMPRAADLYEAGTPPVHGLATEPAPSAHLGHVRFGDQLRVTKVGNRWTVSDDQGLVGFLRWRGRNFPAEGTLYVRKLLLDKRGRVKDIRGFVKPTEGRHGATGC
jgi:hypothetical protein